MVIHQLLFYLKEKNHKNNVNSMSIHPSLPFGQPLASRVNTLKDTSFSFLPSSEPLLCTRFSRMLWLDGKGSLSPSSQGPYI